VVSRFLLGVFRESSLGEPDGAGSSFVFYGVLKPGVTG
jgi:hypothetical protein